MRLLIFGFGFTGRALASRSIGFGWRIAGTSRSVSGRAAMEALGVEPIDPADPQALGQAARVASAVLIATPPDDEGCPGLHALAPVLERSRLSDLRPDWIGYLSTTGVYGDRGGGWVFERSALAPMSPEGERRARAERDWLTFGAKQELKVSVFRLPGIYGPGRSPLDRLRAGEARRIAKPGHVFSRIHVDDLASGLEASIVRPRAAGVYNLCDDEPCPAAEVTAYAARLLGMEPPQEQALDEAVLSPLARRFWAESKRVSNAKAKAALGWRPRYPSYREGLAAVLAEERVRASTSSA